MAHDLDCTPGAYPLFSARAAMACESDEGWPVSQFILPLGLYLLTQRAYTIVLFTGLWEILEVFLRDWFLDPDPPYAASFFLAGYESPAGSLVYDWLAQGVWAVVMGALFVRCTGLPRVLPLYGDLVARPSSATGGGAASSSIGVSGGRKLAAGARRAVSRPATGAAGVGAESFPPSTQDFDAWSFNDIRGKVRRRLPWRVCCYPRRPAFYARLAEKDRPAAARGWAITILWALASWWLGLGLAWGMPLLWLTSTALFAAALYTLPEPYAYAAWRESDAPTPRWAVLTMYSVFSGLLCLAGSVPPPRTRYICLLCTQAIATLPLLIWALVLTFRGR